MRQTDIMPAADGVTPGNRPTWRLPIGMRYHSLIAELSGVNVSQITDIAVKVNNETVHSYSGSLRNRFNKFFGLADAANARLVIPFDRIGMISRELAESTALNTGVAGKDGSIISAVTLEMQLASGSYTPSIKLSAERSEAVAGGPGDIQRILPDTLVASAAGEREFILTESDIGDARKMLLDWAWFDTEHIQRLELTMDRVKKFDRSDALNDHLQANGKRVPDAAAFVLDTSEAGYGTNFIPLRGVRDFRYGATMAAAATFSRYSAYIGKLR